ncbi:MAG: hypothetical protein FJ122_11625 [Deltaproteobacteria bacterium]|nr:hypothetical protein [Deltaproteobacteria bacterium]
MLDIAADIFRAVITGVIFFYLRSIRGKEPHHLRKVWIFFIIGFGLLFLGGLMNIADHFPALARYLAFGRHRYADFLEQIVGYALGFLFLGIGFWQWIPAILALRKSQEDLKRQVAELTAERNKLKAIIECELRYAENENAVPSPEGPR